MWLSLCNELTKTTVAQFYWHSLLFLWSQSSPEQRQTFCSCLTKTKTRSVHVTMIIHTSSEIFTVVKLWNPSFWDVMLSVGKQFLTFQRIGVPSFWGVQNEATVSFSTNEPATQCHIPQELILFGELISCSEDTQYTTVHCMGKMQNSWMWKLMVHIIANIHVM